jgi:hypothetical protein
MTMLTKNDLRFVVSRLPKDIRDLLTRQAGKLFVGGGFVRATIAGEEPSDIDIFGSEKDWLIGIANELATKREGSKLHKTDNAITLLYPGRLTVQFITRWTFATAKELIDSFDFTICQAVVWREGIEEHSSWGSAAGASFYIDLAGRRLVYTHPVRNEDAGGSLMRAIKYTKRGYSIQVAALGGVCARLTGAVKGFDNLSEHQRTGILTGLLREVDPLVAIDGFEVVDEHAPVPGFTDDDTTKGDR